MGGVLYIFFFGGQVEQPPLEGWLEYTTSGKLHYTIGADGVIHYSTSGQLQYTLPELLAHFAVAGNCHYTVPAEDGS